MHNIQILFGLAARYRKRKLSKKTATYYYPIACLISMRDATRYNVSCPSLMVQYRMQKILSQGAPVAHGVVSLPRRGTAVYMYTHVCCYYC